MKKKLTAIVEQGLAQIGAANCKIVDVIISQRNPGLAVIILAYAGKKPLTILIEDFVHQSDIEQFILGKLHTYVTTDE